MSMCAFTGLVPTLAAAETGGLSAYFHRWFFDTPGQSLGASDIDDVFMGIWWLSVFCFVVLMALMLYWGVKYRRRPGKIAQASTSHNTPLEIAWTVLPLGIMAIMFFKGFHGYMAHTVVPAGALELDLTAQKWDWSITYPKGEQSPEKVLVGDKLAPVFVVPAGVPVKIRMKSIDVIHSFWVPDFRGKFDVMPNRYTVYWFQADEPKSYGPGDPHPVATFPPGSPAAGAPYQDHWIFCAEYCGDSHAEMTGIIRVVSQSVYDKIVGTWGTAGMTPVQLGQRVWTVKCSSCHTTDGKVGTGPTWKDIYGEEVKFTDGTSTKVDDNYIRESILEPGKHIVAGFANQMTSFQGLIKEEEIAGVIAYIKSLSAHTAEGGAGAPAEGKPGEAKPAETKAPGAAPAAEQGKK